MLRPAAGGQAVVQAEGTTVGEVFDDLVSRYPELKALVFGPDGDLHRHLNVFLNDDDVRYLGKLDAKVSDDDTLTLMPAVAGG
jgi:molybdopterin converting factor small subunit